MELHEEKGGNSFPPYAEIEILKPFEINKNSISEEDNNSKQVNTNRISKLSNISDAINKVETNFGPADGRNKITDNELISDEQRRYTPKTIDKGKTIFRDRYIKNYMLTIKETFQFKQAKPVISHSYTNNYDIKNNKSQYEEEKKKQKFSSLFIKKTEKAIFSFNLKKYEDSYNELINSKIIKSEEEFAEFLLVITGFDKFLIGEFLSKEKPPNKGLVILKAFMNKIDFSTIPFMDSFRFLFTRLFLPRDSSLILTIIDEYSQAYYNDNKGSKLFADANAIYLLCSCVLALNTMFTRTDIKNLIIMKKEDFIKMNKDCDKTFISDVYDNVKAKKMDMTHDYHEIIYRRLAINMSQVQTNEQEEALNDKVTKEYLELLKKGEKFIKYGNYATPHERFFHLSNDESQLLWCDKNTCQLFQSMKYIEILKIKEIYVGATSSKVFEKFNIPFEDDQKCFSIVTDKRTLDLRNDNDTTSRKWYLALKFLIRKVKSVNQLDEVKKSNHKNEEVMTEIWNTEIVPKWNSYRNYVIKDLRNKIEDSSTKKPKKKYFNIGNKEIQNTNGQDKLFEQNKFFYIWSSGIPKLFRKKIWEIVIGNNSSVTENLVKYYLEKIETVEFDKLNQLYIENNDNNVSSTNSKRQIITFNEDILLNEIISDIIKLANKKFQIEISQENIDNIAFMSDLFKIVRVFLLYRPDVTFSKQLVYIAAVLLLNSDDYFQAFINLTNFTLSSYVIKFMKNNESFIKNRYLIFNNLLHVYAPKLEAHFNKLEIIPQLYLLKWLEYIFIKTFDYKTLIRLWDIYLLKGEIFLYEVAIALLKLQENDLLSMSIGAILINLKHLPSKFTEEEFFALIDEIDIYDEFIKEINEIELGNEKIILFQSFLNDNCI